MRCHYISIRMSKYGSLPAQNADEEVKQKEHSFIAGGVPL